MATLYADSASSPVKLRDLSSQGGLIEGAVIPTPETIVRLVRGELSIIGEIVWSGAGRAGVRFNSVLSVADWFPGGRAIAPQQRVDKLVQLVKSTKKPPFRAHPEIEIQQSKISQRELKRLRVAINSLAEDLVGDPEVVRRHAKKLQTLDEVAQVLARLAIER